MSLTPYTVLVIDDEVEVCELLVEELQELDDVRILQANNGREGWAIFEKEEVDCVISDIKMPFISGPELAQKIIEVNSKIPIYFITAYRDEMAEDFRYLGIKGLIYKPFNIDEIVKMVFS